MPSSRPSHLKKNLINPRGTESSEPPQQADPRRRGRSRTAFTPLLEALAASVGHALAALLVDDEGELVDCAFPVQNLQSPIGGVTSEDEPAVAAAHWQLVCRALKAQPTLRFRSLHITTEHRSYAVTPLPMDYALVLLLNKSADIAHTDHELAKVARAIALEAAWTSHPPSLNTHVKTDT